MELNKKNTKRIIQIITFTVILYLGINNIGTVLNSVNVLWSLVFPFILGGSLAFILNVPMRFWERELFGRYKGTKYRRLFKRIKRPVSFMLTLILVLGAIFVMMFLILPELGATLTSIVERLPAFFKQSEKWVNDLIEQYSWLTQALKDIDFNWNQITNDAMGFIQTSMGNLLESTLVFATSIISGVVTFVLGFVFAVYILFQKERLAIQAKSLLYAYLKEHIADKIIKVVRLSERIFTKFLAGQCLEGVILGVLFFVVLTIFRYPYTLLISVMIGFFSLIPILGSFLGCFISIFFILMVDPVKAIWFVVIFLVIQQFEGNIIYPRVVGSSIGLPPMLVLVAVTLGGNIFGVVGILLFIPLTSVVYILLKENTKKQLQRKQIKKSKVH